MQKLKQKLTDSIISRSASLFMALPQGNSAPSTTPTTTAATVQERLLCLYETKVVRHLHCHNARTTIISIPSLYLEFSNLLNLLDIFNRRVNTAHIITDTNAPKRKVAAALGTHISVFDSKIPLATRQLNGIPRRLRYETI